MSTQCQYKLLNNKQINKEKEKKTNKQTKTKQNKNGVCGVRGIQYYVSYAFGFDVVVMVLAMRGRETASYLLVEVLCIHFCSTYKERCALPCR